VHRGLVLYHVGPLRERQVANVALVRLNFHVLFKDMPAQVCETIKPNFAFAALSAWHYRRVVLAVLVLLQPFLSIKLPAAKAMVRQLFLDVLSVDEFLARFIHRCRRCRTTALRRPRLGLGLGLG